MLQKDAAGDKPRGTCLGRLSVQVHVCAQYDSMTGEVVGVFESLQPSDTDMGSKAPKEVRIEGIWYGQLA